MCDRVRQCGRLAARVWTLHASFIPLTSNKAEALLVMMWLLLPIMPRCRPSRKTVRYILFVPRRPAYGDQHFGALLWSVFTLLRNVPTHSWNLIHKTVLQPDVWFHHIMLSQISLMSWDIDIQNSPHSSFVCRSFLFFFTVRSFSLLNSEYPLWEWNSPHGNQQGIGHGHQVSNRLWNSRFILRLYTRPPKLS